MLTRSGNEEDVLKKLLLSALISTVLVVALAACGETAAPQTQIVEVPKEIIVEKEVIKEVPVVQVVEKEVVKTVQMPGETVLVEKEIEVVKTIEVPVETIKEVVKIVEVPTMLLPEFGEAPMLAQLAAAGKILPVADRIGQDPLVISVPEVGRYGGTWRKAHSSPNDSWSYGRLNKTSLVRWSTDGTRLLPGVAKSWTMSSDGKVWTWNLRQGMRWSDGMPLTADDYIFQYEDIIHNEVLSIPTEKRGGNRLGVMEKVDDFTITMTFDDANFNFLEVLSQTDTPGFLTPGWQSGIPYSPSHFLKQYLPKYAEGGEMALDAMAKEAGVEGWAQLFIEKFSTIDRSADRPTVAPWIMTSGFREPQARSERNPYFYGIDQEGNQLPYIDRVVWDLIPDTEVINLKALAGEIDMQTRHIQFQNFPVLKENEDQGNYHLALWKTFAGGQGMVFNNTYDGPERKWLSNSEFRKAMNLAVDRNAINEITYLGLGSVRQPVPSRTHPFYPGDKYANMNIQHDPDMASQILDSIGLDKKDSDGFRMDGDSALQIVITVQSGTVSADLAEQVAQYWEAVGVKTKVDAVIRATSDTKGRAGQLQVCAGGPAAHFMLSAANITIPRTTTECNMSQDWSTWNQTDGAQGIEPPDDVKRMIQLIDEAKNVSLEDAAAKVQEAFRLMTGGAYVLGLVGQVPCVVVISNNMGNVPEEAACNWPIRTPANAFPEGFFFRQ
jgi:peptide/nickel transport system substrate-binding protein